MFLARPSKPCLVRPFRSLNFVLKACISSAPSVHRFRHGHRFWAPYRSEQTRGKKTKTIKLADLPQGAIKPVDPPLQDDDGSPAYPTVVLQARRNMQKFDNCVLLTRVGGFYELYFEHAEEYGPLLNLKLASKKTAAGPVPMVCSTKVSMVVMKRKADVKLQAGFPFFQLDRFLKVLVQELNRYVAIAEEFPNNAAEKVKSGGLMHDRKVARIVTPGTLIDENFIDPYANNYVMAIHVHLDEEQDVALLKAAKTSDSEPDQRSRTQRFGLAWLDLSTGHFFTQTTDLVSLPSILSRIGPREVVLEQDLEMRSDHDLRLLLNDERYLITYAKQGGLTDLAEWTPMLEEEVPERARQSFSSEEILAGSLVLNYVRDRLQGTAMKLQPPMRRESMQNMNIDKNSLRALEIRQTLRDGFFRGSLLHAIRRTVTKSGARLLNDWLSSPSTSVDVINARQNVVARFLSAKDLRDSIVMYLRRSHDSQRLVQKFALGRGDADDLLDLAATIQATHDIVVILKDAAISSGKCETEADCLLSMSSRIDLTQPLKLASCIKEAIDEEGIHHHHELESAEADQMIAFAQDVVATEGTDDATILPKARKKRSFSIREYYADDNEAWIMKPGASPALQKLHDQLAALSEEKIALGENLRKRLDVPSLTLRWTPGLGHIAHVRGKDTTKLAEMRALSLSRSTRSMHIPEWTALGQRLDHARYQIRREEQRVFQSLLEKVVQNLLKLRRNAAVLDELDIATSFAKLAVEHNLTRPKVSNSASHAIIGGRHPTVEGGLLEQGRSFVRNDCFVGTPTHGLLWLITGPNMAGKSTFLRQNALITILAQVGCYVPASYAELGIVDAIFSRVGSADDLYRDQSTFMVEMLETAQILRQATPRSFVIMDEIGRGTTPEDGIAVSYACLHHLTTVNRCRTLFATHFHSVADLAANAGLCAATGGQVQTYCTDIEEDGKGGFIYVHRLRKGINRHSHALKVARLAGMPEHTIKVAQRIIDELSEDLPAAKQTLADESG